MHETKKHYLVAECTNCKRFLLAVSTNETRTCPYCGKRVRMRDAQVVARSDTAEGARLILQKLKVEGNNGEPLGPHQLERVTLADKDQKGQYAMQSYIENMPKLEPDNVFALDPGIRWVGLATRQGNVVFSQMRPGVTSLTPEADDHLLLEVRGQYITEVCDQVDQWAGPTQYIAMVHERFSELIIILKRNYLAVTLERTCPVERFASLAKEVQELWFNL